MQHVTAERSTALLGVILVMAGVTLFAVVDAAGKLLSEQHSVVQIVWARYAFAVPVLLATTPREPVADAVPGRSSLWCRRAGA